MGAHISLESKPSIYFAAAGLALLSSVFLYKPLLRKISLGMLINAKNQIKENRPKRIILTRHGQSEANVNHEIYTHIPDNQISLTEKGMEQAEDAARILRELIGKESINFMVSP